MKVVLVIVGILLIAFGIYATIYKGITYKEREEIVDLGPLDVEKETTRTVPMSPILGVLALAGGVILLVTGSRARHA